MVSHIDLRQFCHSDPVKPRPELQHPFSCGAYSYATNGEIMVRVPKREDAAENPAAPNEKAARLFEHYMPRKLRCRPAPQFDLVEPFEWEEESQCGRCEGSGRNQHCPSCSCKCSKCGGTGKLTISNWRRATVAGVTYQAKYLSWLQSLPDLKLGPPRTTRALAFQFTGGEGLLMPCQPEG
jgi:hypothetical protein